MGLLITTGSIAEELNVDRDAVAYAIRRLHIRPIARAGLVRIFPDNTTDEIRRFLKEEVRSRKLRRPYGNSQPDSR
jgi:hypothetical protein